MSNHKDNTDKQNLKDLLNKKNQPEESLDAFEQEALEGFAMLESDQEAFELKNKLDSKLYSEVFTDEKKSAGRYWYAAAGLLLVVGFSVYLFRNSELKEDELAIESTSGVKLQKSIEEQTLKNQDLRFEQTEGAASESELSSKKWQEDLESDRSAPASEPAPKKSALKTDERESTEQANNPEASEVMSTPSAPVGYNTAPAVEGGAIQAEQTADKEMLSNAEEKSLREADAKKDVLARNEVAKKSKAPTDRMKSQARDDSNAPKASSGAALDSTLSEISDKVAFKKELKESLSAKNLNGKFDASLKFDTMGKVEKVVFKNAFDFSKSQQKEITQIIKDLKSLKFKTLSGTAPQQYYLEYRP